jgi:signal transduction histidine kinase
MIGVLGRSLFWRVYVTLLISLVLTAVLAGVVTAMLWGAAMDRPSGPGAPGAVLANLLPPASAPETQTKAVLQRLADATGRRIALSNAETGVRIAAAPGGLVTVSTLYGPGWTNRRIVVPNPWGAHLGGGRELWVERLPGGASPIWHILTMLLLVAAAVGITAYPVVARLTRRLERLRASVDAWGEQSLATRADTGGDDEIASVAASFNRAADRVERLLGAHKALLAHASHELRSPLARLRVAVEMLAARPDPNMLPAIERDIAELDALVDEILLASRLDQTAPPADEPVDCLALAAEEAARARAVLHHAEGVAYEVRGQPRLLRRLIRNLLENAGKHGRPPVEIDLDRMVEQGRAWIVIGVHDRGPGIPEAERARVFEPFYRPAGWAEAAGSWGLGLSIVRQIAQRQGGDVTCRARLGGGASFIVRLPAV